METLDKHYDFREVEPRWQAYWEQEGIFRFDPNAPGEIFSVDTPPPYVSAAHLHVGHAMSYAQAEFLVRFHRMRGRNVFYPMGFDDNGLPTERYVEKKYDIAPGSMKRSDFVALCLEETRKGAKTYEKLWRALGLSVDWTQTYSTIDARCQRISQFSFLDLYRRGLIERRNDPIQWCPFCRTSLAQADIEFVDRKTYLHDVAFSAPDGRDLVISTTRPELIPACVALYFHPDDSRYADLRGGRARVPLFDYDVPILTDETVDPAFGTGLMMVCTFGDTADVEKFRKDRLDLRLVVGRDGKLTELAGPFAGKTTTEARKAIVKALDEAGRLRGSKLIDQSVGVHDRCSTPIEFNVAPQWFIRVLDFKEDFLRRGDELRWFPEFMKPRYRDWVQGLKWDWNISRQRFYGVPFPVWYCASCDEVIAARAEDLPVDPTEQAPPVSKCPRCGATEFRPEPDVMDTWMTSSLTPQINAWWAHPGKERMDLLFPMTVRVQAFEIIRTWLFYSVVKAHFHQDSVPWHDVMISGWGLNEKGRKISKRDLSKSTSPDGFNRYDPYHVIQKYGADSLRYWATGASLGHDLRYTERDVKAGKRLLTKLWNASRFALMYLEGFDPNTDVPLAERTATDRWVWHRLHVTVERTTRALEAYDFAPAREAIDRFFWRDFCDNYLEMIKDRFWLPERFSDAERLSAQVTLYATLRHVLALYAIFLPHITEELYQRIYRPHEGARSLHVTRWPEVDPSALAPVSEADALIELLGAVRQQRTAMRLPNSRRLQRVVVDAPEAFRTAIESIRSDAYAALRTAELAFGPASGPTDIEGVRVDIEPAPEA